jgi:hypothetical protein
MNAEQVLGADLGVGTRVEQQGRAARHRQQHGDRRAVHALQALDVQHRRGQRGARRAGRNEPVDLAGRDGTGGADDRRILLRPDGADRLLGVRDRHRGVDDLEAVDRADERLELGRRSVDAHRDTGAAGALADRLEAAVGSMRIERDHRARRSRGRSRRSA